MPLRYLVTFAFIALSSAAWADDTPNLTATRKPLLQKDFDLTANHLQTRVLHVTFPPGYKTPLHTHEGPGPRYVLKGKVKIDEGGTSHVYEPGEAFWESGQWMTAENVGDSEAEVLVIELAAPK